MASSIASSVASSVANLKQQSVESGPQNVSITFVNVSNLKFLLGMLVDTSVVSLFVATLIDRMNFIHLMMLS